MVASRPLYRARKPTQRHLHKCPVTVGEYSSIFFHRSLLTPMYSRNFTSQTLCSSFDWASAGRRLGASAQLWILRRFGVGGSAARLVGGCLAWSRSPVILGLGRVGGSNLFLTRGPPPALQSLHTLRTTRRVVNISITRRRISSDVSGVGGSSGEG
jgi:hypothetical protein